mmetsp:Transcript_29466/g.76050  ORF Transcript_29466/g.76050 Transcript_29466/m.76050 type:complete len:93 (-) Transcript_29466:453-731(-)
MLPFFETATFSKHRRNERKDGREHAQPPLWLELSVSRRERREEGEKKSAYVYVAYAASIDIHLYICIFCSLITQMAGQNTLRIESASYLPLQ